MQDGSLLTGQDTAAQRWFEGRHNFRPSREPIDPARYGVEPIGYSVAKAFVVRHHYSGSFVYAVESYGLFRRDSPFTPSRLVGVATFSTPSNPASIMRWTGMATTEGVELGRFVLLDECEGNAETWFLARALRLLKSMRPQVRCVLSYSDPVPRTAADGGVVWPGHYGCIYQSCNALYFGRASAKTMFVDAKGVVIANRILSKLRNGEQGWRYAERVLADTVGLRREPGESGRAFVERALAGLRRVRHPGNHLYCFPLITSAFDRKSFLSNPVIQANTQTRSAMPKRPDTVHGFVHTKGQGRGRPGPLNLELWS